MTAVAGLDSRCRVLHNPQPANNKAAAGR